MSLPPSPLSSSSFIDRLASGLALWWLFVFCNNNNNALFGGPLAVAAVPKSQVEVQLLVYNRCNETIWPHFDAANSSTLGLHIEAMPPNSSSTLNVSYGLFFTQIYAATQGHNVSLDSNSSIADTGNRSDSSAALGLLSLRNGERPNMRKGLFRYDEYAVEVAPQTGGAPLVPLAIRPTPGTFHVAQSLLSDPTAYYMPYYLRSNASGTVSWLTPLDEWARELPKGARPQPYYCKSTLELDVAQVGVCIRDDARHSADYEIVFCPDTTNVSRFITEHRIRLENRCEERIWANFVLATDDGDEQLQPIGIEANGATQIEVPDAWHAKAIWGETDCEKRHKDENGTMDGRIEQLGSEAPRNCSVYAGSHDCHYCANTRAQLELAKNAVLNDDYVSGPNENHSVPVDVEPVAGTFLKFARKEDDPTYDRSNGVSYFCNATINFNLLHIYCKGKEGKLSADYSIVFCRQNANSTRHIVPLKAAEYSKISAPPKGLKKKIRAASSHRRLFWAIVLLSIVAIALACLYLYLKSAKAKRAVENCLSFLNPAARLRMAVSRIHYTRYSNDSSDLASIGGEFESQRTDGRNAVRLELSNM